MDAGDLHSAGKLVGHQCRHRKEKRDAAGNCNRPAGSTILLLLEETEESRRSAKLVGAINLDCGMFYEFSKL
jgi:hypothetical protein